MRILFENVMLSSAADTTPLTITVGEGKAAETFDLGASVREEVEIEEK